MALKITLIAVALTSVACVTAAQATQPSLQDYYRQTPAEKYAPPAVSESDANAPPETPVGGSHVVTSISKCYEELGADESAEIKRNSLTPYADCQKRLRERAIEKKAERAVPEAETPRNYRRVIDSDAAAESSEPAPEAKKPAKKK